MIAPSCFLDVFHANTVVVKTIITIKLNQEDRYR